ARQLAVVRAGETGAQRQRALFAGAGSPGVFVAGLAAATLAGTSTPAARRAVPVQDGCSPSR
ncbi:carboxylate--amine ligase, partial [Amycolatopsis sp. NPDC051114]